MPLPLPSHVAPIHTRCRAKTTWSTFAQVSGLAPRRMPRPPRHLLQPQSTPTDAVAVPSDGDLHACRPCCVVLALCAAGFTCRDLLGLLANALRCGINCLDVQMSRAACPPTDNVRQSWAAQTLPSEHLSPRGRDWAPSCHGCARSPRMPLQAGPSGSASRRQSCPLRAEPVDSCVLRRAAVPPPRFHSQGCNALVAIAMPRFWVRDRFTRIPAARTVLLWSNMVGGLSNPAARSRTSSRLGIPLP